MCRMDAYTCVLLSGCFFIGSCTLELLWPLNNVTYTSEIKVNSQNQDRAAGCNIKFAQDMPPNFPNLAVSTDADHWIDIRIKDNIPQNKDFTFSGWFKISNPDGALFHYKCDDTTDQFLELKAVLKNSSIIFTRKLKTANETGSIGVTLSPNSWNYLAFGIDISHGKMEIDHFETRILELDYNLMADIDIKLPGTLRIGSSFDEVDPNFDGAVTCFAYHHKLNVPSSDSENECKNTTPDESYIPICPDRNLRTISTSNVCSVFQCGIVCLKLTSCKYIQYNLTTEGCSTCYLLTIGSVSLDLNNGEVFELG